MPSYMTMSQLYAPTLKEDPAEAELASHRLLLRAGMIRRTASGVYSYLPLAWRSIKKIEQIVREEMDAIGAQEMLCPILSPAELWEESGRWALYGPELMRVVDRHERAFALGPTHEETITDLVRGELRSYKQLPLSLYQIQTKFRDELRPRFGLMRGREFIMKDAYSFDATREGMQKSYDAMKGAYGRICERCGLKAVPVVADSGQIGGDTSVEFMALASAGEAAIVHCSCGYAADEEAASVKVAVSEGPGGPEVERVYTPGLGAIADVAAFFTVPKNACRKSLALMDGEGQPVVCIISGDHEFNEVKAAKHFGKFHLMDDEELKKTGLVKGFIGPVGLPEGVALFCDTSLQSSNCWLVGANEANYHLTGVRPGRDFEPTAWLDLTSAQAGDCCPVCGEPLQEARGIEVSQVFQIGTKYSQALNATFMDEDGKEKPFQMGSYGVGISRTLAAVVEQSNDKAGIIWPVSVAPFEVSVLALSVKDAEVVTVAERLAKELAKAGVDVIFDDRNERAGVKFAEADLMGFPYQLICGKRGIKNGVCELKDRATGERSEVALDEAVALVSHLVEERRA